MYTVYHLEEVEARNVKPGDYLKPTSRDKKEYLDLVHRVKQNIVPMINDRIRQIKGVSVVWRQKDMFSAMQKFERKPDKYQKFEDLGDLFGFRVHSDDINEFKDKEKELRELFNDIIDKLSDYINNPREDYKGVTQYNVNRNIEIQVRHLLHTVVYEISHDFLYKPAKDIGLDERKQKALKRDISTFAEFITEGGKGLFRPQTRIFGEVFFDRLPRELNNESDKSKKKVLLQLWEKRDNIKIRNFDRNLEKLLKQYNIDYKEMLNHLNTQLFLEQNADLTESKKQDLLRKAIRNHKMITFYYEGDENNSEGMRVVEPYVLGTTTAGNKALRAYQLQGDSDTPADVPGWRLFLTKHIQQVTVSDDGFFGKRLGYNKSGDKGLRNIEIHAGKVKKVSQVEKFVEMYKDLMERFFHKVERFKDTDTKSERQRKKQQIDGWVNKVNQYSRVPIQSQDYNLLNKYISHYQENDVWKNLRIPSRNIDQFFRIEPIKKVEGIFYINTQYLTQHCMGNSINYDKLIKVQTALDNKDKFDNHPVLDIKTGKLDDGNHRVYALSQQGYKSIPVKVVWR